ncbi:MAG: SpoIID/LytB domain-containing protein, partial [Anaerolineales bacterium]
MTMKRWRHVLLVLVLPIFLFGPSSLSYTASAEASGFSGVVVDIATESPISGVEVGVGGEVVSTDARGRYRLPVAPGVHEVHLRAPGYIGMRRGWCRLEEGEWADLDFEMVPRDPDQETAAIIDEKMMQVSQVPPPDLLEAIREKRIGLTSVEQVPGTIRVLMPDDSVVEMRMDEYLKGVVPREMPPHWPAEALRAQAVAARTYASTCHRHSDKGADVCTTTHCQVWGPTRYETTDQAVDETHGVAATYDGYLIHAFFFAHCDGETRASEDVWSAYLPYCRPVECSCGKDEMYGHGVGMCQWGAQALAEAGKSYEEILKHYYTDIDVQKQLPGHISDAMVTPQQGDTETEFTYSVSYTSETGELPAVANVIIDGRAHSLYRVPGEDEDTWEYRLVTSLSAGEHTHRFYFEDGYGRVFSLPNQGVFDGPFVEAAEPSAPTPTPVPTPSTGVRVHDVTYSTMEDWGQGSLAGTEVVDDGGDGALALVSGHDRGHYTSPVLTAPFSFISLGMTWHGEVASSEAISLEVQTSEDGVQWSSWQSMPVTEHDGGRYRFFNSDLLFGLARFLRYRVHLNRQGEDVSPVLKNLHLVCIDAREGPMPAEASSGSLMGEMPFVISREAWGAEEELMTWPVKYRPPRAFVLHHTGTMGEGVDAAAMVRAIYYYQAAVCGWGDIFYNYLIDAAGNVYEGRAGGVGAVGGHAGRYSWGGLGVALLGDYAEQEIPEPMLDGLAEFLARQCTEHFIHPLQERAFIDTTLPTIMGHDDCMDTSCPGEALSSALPAIRSRVLEAMGRVPPHIRLIEPTEDERVRDILAPRVQASAVITRVDYYVDGVLRGSDPGDFSWYWNTFEEKEGTRELRLVAHNAGGHDEASAHVVVDNKKGLASVPEWNRLPEITFTFFDVEAVAVQFSNDWVWEGEELYHHKNTGRVVADPQALNGQAWFGEGGVDEDGGWYGPYTCDLADGQDYDVYFRLKTSDNNLAEGLATLDVVDDQVDDQGGRRYDERVLRGTD